MSRWWCLDPTDVWFFRDAKPFTAGESHRAESRFPPLPATVLGALRSALIASSGVSFEQFRNLDEEQISPLQRDMLQRVGRPNRPGSLTVQGPFLCRRRGDAAELLLRPPLDLLGRNWLAPLVEDLPGVIVNDPPLKLFWLAGIGDAGELPTDSWIVLDRLLAYLADPDHPPPLSDPEETPYCRETRTGLELGPGRAARAGLFYIAEMVRMAEDSRGHFGLAFRVDEEAPGQSLPAGPLALGGRARAAELSAMQTQAALAIDEQLAAHANKIKEEIRRTGRFRVYAATPALFQGGWCPDFLSTDADGTSGRLADDTFVELVAAAVGKPEPIGGWDLARGRPKCLYRAVPAGSVYYFRVGKDTPLDEDRVDRLVARFHCAAGFRTDGASVLPEHLTAGFGLTLIGTWKPKTLSERSTLHV